MKTIKISIIIINLILLCIACSKENNKLVSDQIKPIDSVLVECNANSNYLYSYFAVKELETGKKLAEYNYNVNGIKFPIAFKYYAKLGFNYEIKSSSTKNTADSTLHMIGSGPVWNLLIIKTNGNVVYSNKDSIGYGTWKITQNIFYYKF